MLTFRRRHNATSLGFYSGRGLLAFFAATILLPGLLLCAFSVRGLLQERRLAGQQVREQLERTATETTRSLEFELHRWQQLVDEVHLDAAGVPTLPAPLGAAIARHFSASTSTWRCSFWSSRCSFSADTSRFARRGVKRPWRA